MSVEINKYFLDFKFVGVRLIVRFGIVFFEIIFLCFYSNGGIFYFYKWVRRIFLVFFYIVVLYFFWILISIYLKYKSFVLENKEERILVVYFKILLFRVKFLIMLIIEKFNVA